MHDRLYSASVIEQLERDLIKRARVSFWDYRIALRPHMIGTVKDPLIGWFIKDVAHELQLFWADFTAGKRPVLVIEAPPQHGKSIGIVDFIEWVVGLNPDLRIIYSAFSDRLSTRANLWAQRALDSRRYQTIFPKTRLNTENVVAQSSRYLRNRDILEFVGRDGSFRNTTVRGPISGEGLDLGVIDDPIKGREAANSLAVRDNTWDWFTDDFMTRFSEYAGLIISLTRWHIDDPVGRLIIENPEVKVLRYPAIAEEDEYRTIDGVLTRVRKKGDPLFPELKSREFLLTRKGLMTVANWEAVYQQNPIIQGGDMFPVEMARIVPRCPVGVTVKRRVRYWDKAGTSGGGKATAGVLIAELSDGRFLIEDVIRGQWGAFDRETQIKQCAEDDGKTVEVWVEQEPGSGGKESAERSIANLAGWRAYADKVTGDKETRAEPYAAQWQAGNVLMIAAAWNKGFITEHEYFPQGSFKDQVDAAAGAFAKLVKVNEKGKAGVLF